MLAFDPVVEIGLFDVSYRGVYKRFRAIDGDHAMWKMAQYLSVPFGIDMSFVEIEKTLRKSDFARKDN